MYHVNADDLPGNEVSRTLVCIHAAPTMTTQWDD